LRRIGQEVAVGVVVLRPAVEHDDDAAVLRA
jgi:hypothetical protein